MKNNKKTITPNEINKFLYCPYQFYYERYYGRKELTDLYKERNKKLGLENKTLSNFKKGITYHSKYSQLDKYRNIMRNIAIAAVIVILIYLYFRRQ